MTVNVILEQADDGQWSAYTPDDFACILASGPTREKALESFKAAVTSNQKTAAELGMPTVCIDDFSVRDVTVVKQ